MQPKFTRPEVLRNLKPGTLQMLLAPFRGYLASRNVALEADDLDGEALIEVLMTPAETAPNELVEALEMVDLLTDTEALLALESAWGSFVGQVREADDSAGDVAVKLYVRHPEIVWREFDRRAVSEKRSLISYLSSKSARFEPPNRARLGALERMLAPWFEAHARSGICRVRAFEDECGWRSSSATAMCSRG